jgi:hypothetical protein
MTLSFGGQGFPPCWRAYFFLLRQEKVAKKKATPRAAPATPVPCATRNAGRLAKLTCGSDNASRLPPAFLRCSAPSTGTPKASGFRRFAEKADSCGQRSGNGNSFNSFNPPSPPCQGGVRPARHDLLLPLTRGRPGGGLLFNPLGGAEQRSPCQKNWIPASARMTKEGRAHA